MKWVSGFIGRLEDRLTLLFSEILLVCYEEGLLGGTHFALDGLKLPSNASRECSGTFKDLRLKELKLKAKLREHRRAGFSAVRLRSLFWLHTNNSF